LDIRILKKLQYFYSSSPPLFSDQLFYYGSFRKIQQNDVIWEAIFMFDSLVGMVSKGRFEFLIDESMYPSLARIRLSADDHDPYYDQTIFKQNTTNVMEMNVPLHSLELALNSSMSPSSSSSSFFTTSSPSFQPSWKIALGGGLTHTITTSITSTSSLEYLFPVPGTRCPSIRLFFIIRKIIRWLNDSSNKNSSQKPFLPKLNSLMEHIVTRHQLHDALIEWYETLEPQWKSVPQLADWLKLTHGGDNQITFIKNFGISPITLSMFMWSGFSMIHEKSNDNELFSISSFKQHSSILNTMNTIIPVQSPYKVISSKSKFLGTSADWCILSFRSLVRLILELSIHGVHPSIYGLTVPYCVYTSMDSLLREEPISPTTYDDLGNKSFQYISSEKKSKLSIVKGIAVEEILYDVQYQVIPFVTEIANIWVVGSTSIDLMNEFVEKLKRIN